MSNNSEKVVNISDIDTVLAAAAGSIGCLVISRGATKMQTTATNQLFSASCFVLATTIAAGLLAHAMSKPAAPDANMSGTPQYVSGTISWRTPFVDGMDKRDLSRHLFRTGRPFAALATAIEDIRRKAYSDSDGGTTIGIGYNIRQQINARGRNAVIEDMRTARIDERDIVLLLSPVKSDWQQVTISNRQAIALLDRIKPDYRRAASRWLGEDLFESLTPNRQAALTYLAYNVGETNLRKFRMLKQGVRDDNRDMIARHITPVFSYPGQALKIKNHRAGEMLLSAWQDDSRADEHEIGNARGRANF